MNIAHNRIPSEAQERLSIAATAAAEEISSMPPGEDRTLQLRQLARMTFVLPEELCAPAFRACPELRGVSPLPDTHLCPAEQEIAGGLLLPELALIDRVLVANATTSWLSVARIVGATLIELKDQFPGISTGFYAQRVAVLVERGALLGQGNFEFIRSSKVRLASGAPSAA